MILNSILEILSWERAILIMYLYMYNKGEPNCTDFIYSDEL